MLVLWEGMLNSSKFHSFSFFDHCRLFSRFCARCHGALASRDLVFRCQHATYHQQCFSCFYCHIQFKKVWISNVQSFVVAAKETAPAASWFCRNKWLIRRSSSTSLTVSPLSRDRVLFQGDEYLIVDGEIVCRKDYHMLLQNHIHSSMR